MSTDDFDRLPWEPEAGHDYGDVEIEDLSPCCGAECRNFKMKRYCLNCSALVENCCGD